MLGHFSCFWSSVVLCSKTVFQKNISGMQLECQTVKIHIRPDIVVGPNLDPNCLQELSADDTRWQKELSKTFFLSWELRYCT